eukprot:8690174-Alexandrium_andersonii.AAC.1
MRHPTALAIQHDADCRSLSHGSRLVRSDHIGAERASGSKHCHRTGCVAAHRSHRSRCGFRARHHRLRQVGAGPQRGSRP